jgi:hypothetical protein
VLRDRDDQQPALAVDADKPTVQRREDRRRDEVAGVTAGERRWQQRDAGAPVRPNGPLRLTRLPLARGPDGADDLVMDAEL